VSDLWLSADDIGLLFEAFFFGTPSSRLVGITLMRWHQRVVGRSVCAAPNGMNVKHIGVFGLWGAIQAPMRTASAWLMRFVYAGLGGGLLLGLILADDKVGIYT
jgi:hypothetical protein